MTKDRLKELHMLLSEFEDHLARKYTPPNWNAAEVESVRVLSEALENIIRIEE